jgi:hypothetical protein
MRRASRRRINSHRLRFATSLGEAIGYRALGDELARANGGTVLATLISARAALARARRNFSNVCRISVATLFV